MKIIRWILSLPAGVLFSLVASVLLHLILYRTLSGNSGNGEPLISEYPEAPEKLLTPFIMSLAFILGAVYVVPDHKFKVSIALCAIVLFGSGMALALGLFNVVVGNQQFNIQYGGIPNILCVVGACLAVYLTWKKEIQTV